MQNNTIKNIAILCNSLAGAGKADNFAEIIIKELSKKKIAFTLFKEAWPIHLNDFTDIFILGGDGTLNYFINHYQGIKLPLVIFNAGTGNDFHWMLYANKTFKEQLQTALTGNPKPVDIGKCNEQFFINGIGIGYEGKVVYALSGKKKRPGKASFLICILKNIFTYRSKNYSISSGGSFFEGKKLMVDIYKGRRAGGGFNIAPEAMVNNGLFDVIIVEAINPFQRLRYLPVIEKGKHLRLPFITFHRTKKITVESDMPIQCHLDGEYFEAQKLEIEILPSALNFRF